MMPKWIDDLFRNIDVWILRRLHKLLQHGGEDFAVSLDTLHAHLADKESKVAAVYNDLEERLVNVEEGVPVRPLPAEVEGLPSVRDLNHLRASVGLLAERKIEDASPDIPDGVSLVRLLCDSSLASQVTELIDTNKGYVCDKVLSNLFPNCQRAIFGMSSITVSNALANISANYVELPNLISINHGTDWQKDPMPTNARVIIAPVLETASAVFSRNYPSFEELYFPNLTTLTSRSFWYSGGENLRKLVVPKLITFDSYFLSAADTSKLIHLEIGSTANCNIANWSPTNALRTDTTASDYIDLREDKDDSGEFIYQNNLQQFLSNFKNYIADRLADRSQTTSLTLTLSQAVYDAIQADTEFAIIPTLISKNWNITV